MKRTVKWVLCLLLAAILIACSSVAFTGRNRVLLYSDSEITSLSNESYNELMSTSKISDNKAQTAMIEEVGKRITGALTKYLASKGEQSLLDIALRKAYGLSAVKNTPANARDMGSIPVLE